MSIPRILKPLSVLLAFGALTACYNDIPKDDPRHAEMLEHKAWLDRLKADDPATAKLLAQTCYEEGVGSAFTSEGVLELSRCMHRKYDEGVRA
ncbi:MAG: hypothetical protein ACJ8D6_05155 [Sphingomicrobium sp.]